MDAVDSEYGPVVGCCEDGNVTSGFIKVGQILDQLRQLSSPGEILRDGIN